MEYQSSPRRTIGSPVRGQLTESPTQPAPAAFTLFGVPDQATQENKYAIQIPYLLGLIATRSVDTPVTGLKDLLAQHEVRIRNGMKAYALLATSAVLLIPNRKGAKRA